MYLNSRSNIFRADLYSRVLRTPNSHIRADLNSRTYLWIKTIKIDKIRCIEVIFSKLTERYCSSIISICWEEVMNACGQHFLLWVDENLRNMWVDGITIYVPMQGERRLLKSFSGICILSSYSCRLVSKSFRLENVGGKTTSAIAQTARVPRTHVFSRDSLPSSISHQHCQLWYMLRASHSRLWDWCPYQRVMIQWEINKGT